ncbi:hypothetical protein R6Q59_032903 [Mikania micrantha]
MTNYHNVGPIAPFSSIFTGLLQTLAFIEVIHGALGIVPSGFLFPLMQWGGRTHFLLAIVRKIYEVQELPAVLITFVSWCCIEIIRYPFYALSCLGNCPSFLTYLRYTAFIVIYPIGVAGEMWIMYQSLPFIMEKNLYADYFAAIPFSYHTFVKAVLICYPFLWLQMTPDKIEVRLEPIEIVRVLIYASAHRKHQNNKRMTLKRNSTIVAVV